MNCYRTLITTKVNTHITGKSLRLSKAVNKTNKLLVINKNIEQEVKLPSLVLNDSNVYVCDERDSLFNYTLCLFCSKDCASTEFTTKQIKLKPQKKMSKLT